MTNKNLADFQVSISRRQVLLGLASVAAVATLGLAPQSVLAAETALPKPLPLTVQPFELTDVRLLDGPFLHAQKQDEKYLLSLDADRMLHNFHVNAGLPPKGEIYKGWESEGEWAGIRCHGHTLGHYLSACAMMFATTGDVKFKERCDYIISELKKCQEAAKTGLINAFPDNETQFKNVTAGRRLTGVPWYTMHKILAGLRDVHYYGKNPDALPILTKLCDYFIEITKNLTDQQFQSMLGTEHGGMNETLADLYVITNEKKYLDLAVRFCHKDLLDPFSNQNDNLNGKHSNTQIPKFVGFHRVHQVTGEANYKNASKYFWDSVVKTRSFITGGNGDGEHFFPVNQFAQKISSAKTMETCCSHNMLKLTRSLFTLEPNADYADYYERALFNTILASQDPDSGMMTYFQSTRPGYMKLFHTPIDSFWCCTGSGMENHAKYGDSIYFQNGKQLYVNLYIASTLNWKAQGVTIEQSTKFPYDSKVTLKFKTSSTKSLDLNIRHPAWCAKVDVKLNGAPLLTSENPGYIAIDRDWKDGDTLEISLPMTLKHEMLPNSTNYVSFICGPVVLVGKLGTEGITPGADIVKNERQIGNYINNKVDVPNLAKKPEELIKEIKPVEGSPLTFSIPTPNYPNPVTLVPYFSAAHFRYVMYWQINA